MAMRRPRPRIKANLLSSRKPRAQVETENESRKEKTITGTTDDKITTIKADTAEHQIEPTETVLEAEILSPNAIESTKQESSNNTGQQTATAAVTSEFVNCNSKDSFSSEITSISELVANNLVHGSSESDDAINSTPKIEIGNSAFKCPQKKVDFSRSTSLVAANVDDVFHSDIEDLNVIQMDLQKSMAGASMSPSKTQSRQRIRIRQTPIFRQRRNSFVGSSPTPHIVDDCPPASVDFVVPSHRRERYHSASLSQTSHASSTHNYHTQHKYAPTVGMGRIRTESGCSAFSDSYAASSKSRKTDEHSHRTFSRRRDFEARFTNGVPEKSSLKMFDLIYYNPATNPMEQKPNISGIKKEYSNVVEEEKPTTGKLEADDRKETVAVPQLKLNQNGELILDDKSLVIETTAEQEARKALANSSLIILDENTGMNGFYKRQKRTKEWQPDETIKFYRCLQTIGTDFSLMCQLFPKRTRRDLKLKFKKEERCNAALINKALLYPKTFNIEELKDQLEVEEREREEAERKWEEIKKRDAKKVKKVLVKNSTAARVLKHGDDIYQNENVVKRKLSKRATPSTSNICKKSQNTPKEQDHTPDNRNSNEKPKHKRRRVHNNNNKIKKEEMCIVTSNVQIKTEAVKHELNSMNVSALNNNDATMNLIDSNQLEDEITELLLTEAVGQSPEAAAVFISDAENEFLSHKTLVNLDDGTVTFVNPVSETILPLPSEADDEMPTGRELSETDIQQILTELAEGSLVLVSTLDPDNADKVLNEIYMLDRHTGELCESPLEIPEVVVQSILSVMS